MRWTISCQALFAGTLVFVIWVALDVPDTKLSQTVTWNLHDHFGKGSAMVWFFAGVRIAGSTLLVPLLEEVFYRSFLYRYILAPNWMFTAHNSFAVKPFLITSIVFGFTHHHWLAGIACGMIYQLLVIRTNRIGDAITAHAVTNLLLGVWVITKGFGYAEKSQWHFW
jgi:CAAX prenyl protease-like protein